MENTTNLTLPYIMPSQAQKHVTHNEALRMLDAIVQLSVRDRERTQPPAEPGDGDRHIVAAGADGTWEGWAGDIAAFVDGAWTRFSPRPGWRAWVEDEQLLLVFDGNGWLVPSGGEAEFDGLGVGTSPDAVNRLSVKADGALFSHDDQTPGTGHMRLSVNKSETARDCAVLFQSDWSGRALVGLLDDDDLTVKVSADGADWIDAIRVDRHNGRAAFPATNLLTDFAVSLLPDSGRFSTSKNIGPIGSYTFPSSYLGTVNGTTHAAIGRFIHDNDDYGGSAGALHAQVKDLIDKIRSPAHRRHGPEFHVAEITMGSGTSFTTVSVESVTYYFAFRLAQTPRVPAMTFHAYFRALDDPIVFRHFAGQTFVKEGVRSTGNLVVTPAEGWVSVAVEDIQDPFNSTMYNPNPLTIHMASEGDRFLLACPALMGGITRIDPNIGLIAGFNLWLP